jgi:hypothetical protein
MAPPVVKSPIMLPYAGSSGFVLPPTRGPYGRSWPLPHLRTVVLQRSTG